jgi:hypothetical protein
VDIKTIIETMDAAALRQLLADDPSQANALISWGEDREQDQRNITHPLHYVSDVLFTDPAKKGRELELVSALIEAGADVNFQISPRTDTPLIGAASLGAEEVGIALLKAGAKPEIVGIFGETALHWAAHLGEARLVAELIPCSDLNFKDEKFCGSPLDWALHGWRDPQPGNVGRQREVAALLVAAGAKVEPQMLAFEGVQTDPGIFAALTRL